MCTTSKPKYEREQFYEDLQKGIDTVDTKKNITIGDLIGNNLISEVQLHFNKAIENDNGCLLVDFCTLN